MPIAGPVDISRIERAHERFLRDQDNWIREALTIAGSQAKQHVEKRSTFKRRSASRSLKDATRAKIVKTGGGRRLKLTWSKKLRGGYDLAELIEYGTRPHVISVGEEGGGTSTRGKALRFRGRDGRWVFRRRVFHPGTRPYKFGWKALHAAHRVMSQRMDDRVSKARFHF